MSAVLALVRPDDWNFPLFLHVLGAMVLVGATVTAAACSGSPGATPAPPARLLDAARRRRCRVTSHVDGCRVDLLEGRARTRAPDSAWIEHRLHRRRGGAVLFVAALIRWHRRPPPRPMAAARGCSRRRWSSRSCCSQPSSSRSGRWPASPTDPLLARAQDARSGRGAHGARGERRLPDLDADPDEQRVLTLLRDGLAVGEAAQELHISRRTADRRLAAARTKLGVGTTAEAVAPSARAKARARARQARPYWQKEISAGTDATAEPEAGSAGREAGAATLPASGSGGGPWGNLGSPTERPRAPQPGARDRPSDTRRRHSPRAAPCRVHHPAFRGPLQGISLRARPGTSPSPTR